MSQKVNGNHYSMTRRTQDRRERVVERLEYQLEQGIKRHPKTGDEIELTKADRKRINNEISTLKQRC